MLVDKCRFGSSRLLLGTFLILLEVIVLLFQTGGNSLLTISSTAHSTDYDTHIYDVRGLWSVIIVG